MGQRGSMGISFNNDDSMDYKPDKIVDEQEKKLKVI